MKKWLRIVLAIVLALTICCGCTGTGGELPDKPANSDKFAQEAIVEESVEESSQPEESSTESSQPEESSKAVEETDGGFRVSRGGGDPSWDETDVRTAPAAVPEQQEDQPAHKLDASGAPVSELDEKIEKAAESMEQIRPEMNGELMSLTMETALKEGRPPLPIEKKVTPAPEGAKEKKEKKDENADAE